MKLIYKDRQIISKPSNRLNNLDYLKIRALAFIKGYSFSKISKKLIINDEILNVRKLNGQLYAGLINISRQMDHNTDKMIQIYRKKAVITA